jgi:hypothetical protein
VPVSCKLGDESFCWLQCALTQQGPWDFAFERKGDSEKDRRLLGHVMPSCLVDLQLSHYQPGILPTIFSSS